MRSSIAIGLQKTKNVLIFTVVLSFSFAVCFIVYWYAYLPYKADSLYKEGITNVEKAYTNAVMLLNEKYYHRFDDKAVALLSKAANKGIAPSSILLGKYYKRCANCNLEYSKKIEYINKSSYYFLLAAEKGNAEAQKEIGLNYKYGVGVKRNILKALYWLKLSAFKKNPYALYEMGNAYLDGLALYDIPESFLMGPYSSDFDYNNLLYDGENIFVTKDNKKYKAKDKYLNFILDSPQVIYLKPNIIKAKYYWKLAAIQGLQEAKDALEKVYN